MPPVPPSDHEGAHSSQIHGLPPRYVYIYYALPNTHSFNLDAYAKDNMQNRNFIPDFLTVVGIYNV
jgi:hypothetical protein